MIPTVSERNELLKGFSKAIFSRDLDALYAVVTPDFVWSFHDGISAIKLLVDRDAISKHLAEQKALFAAQRFNDVAYHHASEATFMTCRIDETIRVTGEQRKQHGVERYTFKDGKIAVKDVYRKPIVRKEHDDRDPKP